MRRVGNSPGDCFSTNPIQTYLTMKVLFGMALRQTTGFVESLLRLIGLDWAVPDFSTLSRRQKTLTSRTSGVRALTPAPQERQILETRHRRRSRP